MTDHAKAAIDRRLLILYIVLAAVLAASLTYIVYDNNRAETAQAKFELAVIRNCEQGQKNTQAFNDLLDRLVEAVQQNKGYTDAQRQRAVDFYESGRQTVPPCPPVRTETDRR